METLSRSETFWRYNNDKYPGLHDAFENKNNLFLIFLIHDYRRKKLFTPQNKDWVCDFHGCGRSDGISWAKHSGSSSSQVVRCPIPVNCSTYWKQSDPTLERTQVVTVKARSKLGAPFQYDRVEFCRYPAPADWAPALLAANRSNASAPPAAASASAPPLRLAACTMFRSTLQRNAELVAEWVAYHLLQGVEHWYIYANEDPALTRAALAPYVTAGRVEVVDWRWDLPRSKTTGWARQHPQMHSCVHRYRGLAAWVALFDVDEFIQVPPPVRLPAAEAGAATSTLRSFLAEQGPEVGVVAADMYYFADCGVVNDSTLVTQACVPLRLPHSRDFPLAPVLVLPPVCGNAIFFACFSLPGVRLRPPLIDS
jgi:hypothetical protein